MIEVNHRICNQIIRCTRHSSSQFLLPHTNKPGSTHTSEKHRQFTTTTTTATSTTTYSTAELMSTVWRRFRLSVHARSITFALYALAQRYGFSRHSMYFCCPRCNHVCWFVTSPNTKRSHTHTLYCNRTALRVCLCVRVCVLFGGVYIDWKMYARMCVCVLCVRIYDCRRVCVCDCVSVCLCLCLRRPTSECDCRVCEYVWWGIFGGSGFCCCW